MNRFFGLETDLKNDGKFNIVILHKIIDYEKTYKIK